LAYTVPVARWSQGVVLCDQSGRLDRLAQRIELGAFIGPHQQIALFESGRNDIDRLVFAAHQIDALFANVAQQMRDRRSRKPHEVAWM
jgi:hypothetical protein